MWTAVIGEHNRSSEEGHEQRLMVEKVILHEKYREYHNDVGKLLNKLIMTQTLMTAPCLDDVIIKIYIVVETGFKIYYNVNANRDNTLHRS